MKFSKKSFRFIAAIIMTIILLLPGVLQAKEIDLKEAIDWGIRHNYDLEEIRYNIETLERNLEILDAGNAFQVNLDVTPIWNFGGGNIETSLLKLAVEKTIANDLNISADISWNENDFTDITFGEIVEGANASIQLEKQFFPDSYTQSEQQIFQTKNSIKKKVEELAWKETEKQIDFIEGYLSLVRLTEEVSLAEKNLQLATEELERIQQQIRLGEGGYKQEAEAKIALMETENQFLNLKQNLVLQQKEWYLELNLSEDTQVQFNGEFIYLDNLRSNMRQLTLENEKQETLFKQSLEKHYQMKNAHIDRESLLKEAKWTENEGKPQINLSGRYELSSNSWYTMLDLSWNLSDGGAQKLKEKEAEATILQKEKELDQLTKTLQLEMNQIMDQDKYYQLNLQAKLAASEQEQYVKNISEKQYLDKIISSTQWQKQLIALAEKELKVKEAQDLLLVNRLRLAHFLGLQHKES